MKSNHEPPATSYVPVIGMEVHVELATQSKMFCGCPAQHFGIEPNTHTCPVCLGLPGALPVPNATAIDWTRLIGLSLGSTINPFSKFDRKHYFYPDLPKGYQISQYDQPLCSGGQVRVGDTPIGITRVHLEEDTAKLLHTSLDGKKVSLIDFNRSGVPLVEIVTEPDLHSAATAKEFLKFLQQIIRYLGVSDADMEKGSLRLEANVSVSTTGKLSDYKVEIKNVNSFRFIAKAIDYEVNRQTQLLKQGQTPIQETRGWSDKGATISQRTKEQAQDYRYFPEPDIPPLTITLAQIKKLKAQLPELPPAKRNRFITDYQLNLAPATFLTETRQLADYFEETVKVGRQHHIDALKIANVIVNKKVDIDKFLPAHLVKLLVKHTTTKVVDPHQLKAWAQQTIVNMPQAIVDFKAGKTASLESLLGGIMRLSRGQADPQASREILLELLR
ncbi:MAG: Asp-tRNA(Asn)/Glu-tRNA(Gln) amidotransferase subunit GatB [Candidatus Chisholmbacteria bacterium]|nr:Asp-tRNA(Asn)/Glu-tRNA(Gln) amidotransferase subunit GatB [Candidatus Chisholmbacteria bacterium]